MEDISEFQTFLKDIKLLVEKSNYEEIQSYLHDLDRKIKDIDASITEGSGDYLKSYRDELKELLIVLSVFASALEVNPPEAESVRFYILYLIDDLIEKYPLTYGNRRDIRRSPSRVSPIKRSPSRVSPVKRSPRRSGAESTARYHGGGFGGGHHGGFGGGHHGGFGGGHHRGGYGGGYRVQCLHMVAMMDSRAASR